MPIDISHIALYYIDTGGRSFPVRITTFRGCELIESKVRDLSLESKFRVNVVTDTATCTVMKIFWQRSFCRMGKEWGGREWGGEWGVISLVPWLCHSLARDQELCLQFCLIANEAEPLDIRFPRQSQGERVVK
jgi:hypothetical protein